MKQSELTAKSENPIRQLYPVTFRLTEYIEGRESNFGSHTEFLQEFDKEDDKESDFNVLEEMRKVHIQKLHGHNNKIIKPRVTYYARSSENSRKTPPSHSSKTYFRIILNRKDGKPYSNLDYKLTIDGKNYLGRTNSNGLVEQSVPKNSKYGTITFSLDIDGTNKVISRQIKITTSSL